MKKSVLSKDGLIQLWDSISNAFVRKEKGKSLSTNDYTNADKKKVDDLGITYATKSELIDIATTTEKTITNSVAGGLKVNNIFGNSEQNGTPTPNAPVDIKSVVVSEIKTTGKNLIGVSTNSLTTQGVTFTNNNDGSVTVNGTNLGTESLFNLYFKSSAIPNTLEKGVEYIASLASGISNKVSFQIHQYIDNAWRAIAITTQSANSKSFVISEKATGLLIRLQVPANESVSNVTVYPMIEKGSTVSNYEPYTESLIQLSDPITLREKDAIVKRDNVYGVLREYEPFTLDGTQSVSRSLQEGANGVYRFSVVDTLIQSKIKKPKESEVAEILTTAFSAKTYNQVYWSQEGISVYTTGTFHIYYDKFKNFTVEEMKAWLTENPISGIYRLATPVFEPLPEADQIALHELETFDNITNVFTDSDIDPVIELEYGVSAIGGYGLKSLNQAEANKLRIEQLTTLTNNMATQLVGNEV